MPLKQFIEETVQYELRKLLEGAEQGFSFDELMQCSDLDHAKEYLDKHLERVGEGNYRVSYGLDETRVIKLTKADITQNSQEARNSRCLPKQYVVQVLDKHPEFWWIVVERVQKLSLQQFVNEFETRVGSPVRYKTDGRGYDLEEKEVQIMMAIEFGTQPHNPLAQGQRMINNNEWLKNKWYAGLIKALRKCQVQANDFHHKNWGLRPETNELILLDLGFAES